MGEMNIEPDAELEAKVYMLYPVGRTLLVITALFFVLISGSEMHVSTVCVLLPTAGQSFPGQVSTECVV